MDWIIPTVMPLIIVLFMLLVYSAPSIIAVFMRHRHIHAIAGINLLLGWTIVFWVVALIWALMNQRESANGKNDC